VTDVSLRNSEREEIIRVIEDEAPAFSVSDWPDPATLGDELPVVPPLDFEFLPSSFRSLIEDISERMQTPPDYAAAAAVVALAGCVNRRAVIVPKCADFSWRVVPNLWGASVAPPGMMKSPILRAVTSPLIHIEEKWREEFQGELSDFEIEREKAEVRWQAWKEESKKSFKRGKQELTPPDRTLVAPIQRRLVLTDSTFERLHEILKENSTGVFVIRDELTGWLASLDREGRNEERGFFLEAWNGDSPFTVDRISRGSIHVAACCVSLFGNIQPARLRSYLSDAIAGGPTDDGLFQRFQVLVWPDPPRKWHLVDRPPNAGALAKAELVFCALAELSADDPICMRFATDAQELFFAWFGDLEQRIRADSGLAPFFVAHLAKYRRLMPTLAGLFELADRAAAGDELSKGISISLEHTKQAAAFCDYLEAHIRRVYACIISPEIRSARELARHIKCGDLPSPFATRTVYLKGWTGLGTPDRARQALDLLEDAGWVRTEEVARSPKGGRLPENWVVNPKVRNHA
jgi:putative DNA primase/helicase